MLAFHFVDHFRQTKQNLAGLSSKVRSFGTKATVLNSLKLSPSNLLIYVSFPFHYTCVSLRIDALPSFQITASRDVDSIGNEKKKLPLDFACPEHGPPCCTCTTVRTTGLVRHQYFQFIDLTVIRDPNLPRLRATCNLNEEWDSNRLRSRKDES
jgi:hypothetical protein